MIDISFIITGLRTLHWNTLLDSLYESVKKYSFETIFIGPYIPTDKVFNDKNSTFLKNNSSPSVCTQIGSYLAKGKYFALLADDSIFYKDTIDESMDLLLSKNPNKDLIALRHIQTVDYNGITEGFSQRDPRWWKAGTHPILNQAYVNRDWDITCNPLMSLEYYKYLGGIDCRFFHVNYNIHDLTFRAQLDGANVYISPNIVCNTPVHYSRPSTDRLMVMTENNDEPLYKKIWSSPRHSRIDFENWRNEGIQ